MDKKKAEKKVFLVPTDFSEVCFNALKQAVNMSLMMRSKIVLLHIINKDIRSWLKSEGFDVKALDQRLRGVTEGIRSMCPVDIEYILVEGSIYTTIAEVANKINADFIFLGTNGNEGLQHLTGNSAMKIISGTDTPVIVVQKRKFDSLPKLIVLPITNDAGLLEKTQVVVRVASELNAVVHILQIGVDNNALDAAVHNMISCFSRNNIKTMHVVGLEENGFTRQVMSYSMNNNADMILMMSNPDESCTSFFFTSYDEELIFNKAQIPVLCINPRKDTCRKIFAY